MYIVDSCAYYIFTHLLYVSYVLQILCLLRYSSLRYPVTYPISIAVEKMYSHDFHTSNSLPLDETHLVVMRGPIHQEVLPKCVNEESSTERRNYNRQVNRSPQFLFSSPIFALRLNGS